MTQFLFQYLIQVMVVIALAWMTNIYGLCAFAAGVFARRRLECFVIGFVTTTAPIVIPRLRTGFSIAEAQIANNILKVVVVIAFGALLHFVNAYAAHRYRRYILSRWAQEGRVPRTALLRSGAVVAGCALLVWHFGWSFKTGLPLISPPNLASDRLAIAPAQFAPRVAAPHIHPPAVLDSGQGAG